MERLFYVNIDGYPVSFSQIDTHINNIAAGAKGVYDLIDDTLKRLEMSQELNYRLEVIKAATGYIYHLSCDNLLPDVGITEKEYKELGRIVRRAGDGTPIDVEPTPGGGRPKKGGSQ